MIIEERGTGGTSRGKFTRHKDVAWVELGRDTSMPGDPLVATLVSTATHEPLSQVYVDSLTIYDDYDGRYLGRAGDWEGAVRIALGPHSYGHTWYQVKGKSRRYTPAFAREQ